MGPSEYTKEERKSLCEAFLAAHDKLSKYGITKFICTAITVQYSLGHLQPWEVNEAKRIIKARMGYQYTLEDWLKKYHKVPKTEQTPTAMHQYRLAWLDSLIKEFSS